MSITIAVVAQGMMGSGVGKRLHERGAEVRTLLSGRSAASADRASAAGMKPAADENVKNCVANHTKECAEDCKTSRCVSKCEKAARDECKVNVIIAQHVFNGAVTSTPTDQCEVGEPPVCASPNFTPANPCSVIKGTVSNRAFFGGPVTIYVICPPGSPAGIEQPRGTTTTVLGQTCSSATDGSFTVTITNQCSGQTGCYGLIAAAPATRFDCLGDAPVTAPPPNGDPGWDTCTSGGCPDI